MLKASFLAMLLCVAVLLQPRVVSADADCGTVTIASLNWASAELVAEVDRIILRDGYGCQTELVTGDASPMFTALVDQGVPDLIPELWTDALREPLAAAVQAGRVVLGADVLPDSGLEGWWMPAYIAEAHPEIRTVADALSRPELFPAPDDETTALVHNCPAGWPCQAANSNLFRASGAEEQGFQLRDTGSSAGLDASIAIAHEQERGWLGYYWAPSAILGRYHMVRLETSEHDPVEWERCTALIDCEAPIDNGWPENQVRTVVTADFAARVSESVMNYVHSRRWEQGTVSDLLAWMAEHQASGEQAARHFLASREDVWRTWVPENVRQRLIAAM